MTDPLEPLPPDTRWSPSSEASDAASWAGPGSGWPAGWYPDPWVGGGQHRYWDGRAWTVHTAVPPPAPVDSPASSASSASSGSYDSAVGSTTGGATAWSPGGRRRRSSWIAVAGVALVCVVVATVVAVAVHANSHATSSSAAAPGSTPGRSGGPSTTLAPVSNDPSARLLPELGLRNGDVGDDDTIGLIAQGNLVRGTVTLDLCNGDYASESARTARYQVALANPQGNVVLSTEAVLYQSPNGTATAFTELRSRAASCPDDFVPPPAADSGVPATKTTFGPAPDGSWPQTPSVERLAYSFTSIDQQGNTSQSIAVYLRRGRVLLGVYFNQPSGPQAAVDGQTTIPGIVGVFASRIAKLPKRVVTAKVAASAGGSAAA